MTAVKLNNEGSTAFKLGDYETAVSKFTMGISSTADPELLSLLFSNRSSAYLKLERFQEAVSDGKECIKHRPHWSKGYLRLGKALERSGNDKEACDVYMNAIKKNNKHYELLLQPLIDANNKCNHFSFDFMDEINILLGDSKFCNICRGKKNLLQCSHCQCLYYCSKEHQKQDWVRHKFQCKLLAVINKDLLELSTLQLPVDNVLVKKPFQSLHIKDWDVVWQHLECTMQENSFKKLLSEVLSWPLTLISSICKFNLEGKKKLRIHILGADDIYAAKGFFTSFLQIFPLPDTEIVLIGPELVENVKPLQYTNTSGKCISLSFVPDCYHNFTEQGNFILPDLILAYHPGIQDKSYTWEPTLRYIVSNAIPSVFTCWNEDELVCYTGILTDAVLNAKILHKGNAPFPSLLKRHFRERTNYTIKTMNSYWVCFRGGVPMTSGDFEDLFRNTLTECGVSKKDLNELMRNPNAPIPQDISNTFLPFAFDLVCDKVGCLITIGAKRYKDGDYFGALNSLREGIEISQTNLKCTEDEEGRSSRKMFEQKINQLRASAYCYLGLVAKKQGDMLKAIDEWKNAVKIDPNCFDGHFLLACIYEKMDNFTPMEEAFHKAIVLRPTNAACWNGLGNALRCKGDLKGATFAYKKAEEYGLNADMVDLGDHCDLNYNKMFPGNS